MLIFSAADRVLPVCTARSDGRSLVIGSTVRATSSQRESADCETPTSFASLRALIALGADNRCTIFALKLSVVEHKKFQITLPENETPSRRYAAEATTSLTQGALVRDSPSSRGRKRSRRAARGDARAGRPVG